MIEKNIHNIFLKYPEVIYGLTNIAYSEYSSHGNQFSKTVGLCPTPCKPLKRLDLNFNCKNYRFCGG